MSEKPPFNGIRALGESDRSDEFKQERDKLVAGINDWLKGMKEKRDNHSPLADGMLISDQKRVIITDLGPVGRNQRMFSEEIEPGISLSGDGEASPLVLQSVRQDSTKEVEVTEVTGTDPLAWQLRDGMYTESASQEVAAAFSVKDHGTDGSRQYYKYVVMGSGSVQRLFQNENGVHQSTRLRTPDELQMAQMAFSHVAETIK